MDMEISAYNDKKEVEVIKPTFVERIELMNKMYKLPINRTPALPGSIVDRLTKFKSILNKEVNEINDIVDLEMLAYDEEGDIDNQIKERNADIAVAIADLLGDVVVYCYSEALKYGIPLDDVLEKIMDSNETKLDANGEPIYDEDGKFQKGPNYVKPEPAIKELLNAIGVQQGKW